MPDNDQAREKVKALYLKGLNSFFSEKIEDCLAKDIDGNLCIEVKTPLDIAESVFLPRGNIFQRELQWPFAESNQEVGKWGVETEIANVFICGAGAKILGNITIGKNAIIGANAVITKDVAPEAIAVGADQRLVSKSEYDPSESWMI